MTRCSYIPPEGQSVIAIAKERGGTTDGDIQALVDRFGCKAEATLHAVEEDPGEREVTACADHIGHLLDGSLWSIGPVWTPQASDIADITISIVHTPVGIARADFGPPIILSQSPAAPPVVDLGENPTREQVRAAGFNDDSASNREARAAFVPMALPTPQTVGVARPAILIESDHEQIILHPTDCTSDHDGSSATLRIVAPVNGNQHCVLHDWQNARALLHVDGVGPYAMVERSYAASKPGEAWMMTLVLKRIEMVKPSGHATLRAACLTNAVRRTMIQLMAIHNKIPANDDGYRMVRVAIAKTLGVPWETVQLDPQPPGFRVTWNGVGVLWPIRDIVATVEI